MIFMEVLSILYPQYTCVLSISSQKAEVIVMEFGCWVTLYKMPSVPLVGVAPAVKARNDVMPLTDCL